MDSITHEVRITNWKAVIAQCQKRPAGQTQKQWLAENQISEKSYYYWQRKVRREAYSLAAAPQDALSAVKKPETSFVEVPFSVPQGRLAAFWPDAVFKTGNIILEISNTVSSELLGNLLEVVRHAE